MTLYRHEDDGFEGFGNKMRYGSNACFPYEIKVGEELRRNIKAFDNVVDWCHLNIQGEFGVKDYPTNHFFFEYEKEAIYFKLRWHGNE